MLSYVGLFLLTSFCLFPYAGQLSDVSTWKDPAGWISVKGRFFHSPGFLFCPHWSLSPILVHPLNPIIHKREKLGQCSVLISLKWFTHKQLLLPLWQFLYFIPTLSPQPETIQYADIHMDSLVIRGTSKSGPSASRSRQPVDWSCKYGERSWRLLKWVVMKQFLNFT